jgi:glycerol-3-phosphate dehydrogenase (NAD(P)+)
MLKNKEKIVIVGAGAWGSAIANLIAKNNFDVCAISDINEISQEINQNHTNNNFLPEISLSKNLKSSTNLVQEAKLADYIFIVVPTPVVLTILEQLEKVELKPNCGFIFATKGLEGKSLRFFHDIFEEKFPKRNFAILSGPNFAIEVAQEKLTVSNIASKNQEFATEICKLMQNDYFKPILNDDILTCEISAIIKNIMAISCGICDGLKLGENVKAALIIQGIDEIKILAKKLGAKNPNLENPAGFGDIFLTCSTSKSRNNSLGLALAGGEKYEILKQKNTYEGANNAQIIARLSQKLELNLKLCNFICEVLEGKIAISEIKTKILKVIF